MTPLSFTPPTTVPTSLAGRMPPPLHSAARKTPTGKAHSAFRRWFGGRGTSRRDRYLPTYSLASIGSQHCSPRREIQRLRTACSRVQMLVGTTFKVHLDGYNQLPYLTGQQPKSLRTDFAYYND